MKKAKTITALILTATLVAAQGWHVFKLANILTPYMNDFNRNSEAILLSIGLSAGLFFFCVFDNKNKKVINWLTYFELVINWYCWLYIIFFDRVFIKDGFIDYSNPQWHKLEYVGLLISLILSAAIPLLIQNYAPHIDIAGLFKRNKHKSKSDIIKIL